MRILSKKVLFIVSVLAFILFSEILISFIVIRQIPSDLILRDPLSSIKSIFSFSLILKIIPFLILSLILFLFSRRFKYRYLLIAAIVGFVGLLIPWVHFFSQLTELWVISPKISSTFGLAYLTIPVMVFPTALAGIFIGLSGGLLQSGLKNESTIDCYKVLKSRKTCLIEGSVYLILGAVILSGCYFSSHEYLIRDKAASVRTRVTKLEKYYLKGKKESDSKLLTSLAANPKLPLPLIEEIFKRASEFRASGDGQFLNFYQALSQNSKSPGYILSSISQLNISYINTALAVNPGTPEETLINLAKQGPVAARISLSKNPRTPAEALTLLSGESNYVIRRFVALHKNVTKETLMNLANDKDDRVKSVALKELEKFPK